MATEVQYPTKASDLLKEEHKRVTSLLNEWKSASPARKQDISREVLDELSIHTLVEEQILYPAMRTFMDPHRVDISYSEHEKLKGWLNELRSLDPTNIKYLKIRDDIIDRTRRHIAENENEIIPMLERELGEKNLKRMGYFIEETRKRGSKLPGTSLHNFLEEIKGVSGNQ